LIENHIVIGSNPIFDNYCYFPKIISKKIKEIKGYDEIGIVLVLGIKFVGSSPAILILRLLKT
tara:strand:- start:763 stop:951 length:189 start_codon:yes stop_codon:yes gene_type:complete